ncbi:MAG: RagB/SusD family nutrient uptake outer membrane protein [Prevotella sp.]|nr:RagB/SusD family nutrient uptake outer membrane protein [Prevotella sp.]
MKTYLYNKVKRAGRRASSLLLMPLLCAPLFTSCLDTIILPDDKTVDEDFWQTKEDVSAMVNGAYAAMTSYDVLERLIVWGGMRGDEMLLTPQVDVSTTSTALQEMAAVNMQTTNKFATWASFYNVINRCNIVLARSEEVMSVDPNFTLGDYQVDRSQMLALRALCYFYLIRNFRDVPFITEAYMNSSQNMNVAQSAPAYVLEHIIADLEEAAQTAIAARSYGVNEWQRVGWMTDDAINALLADVYLWRASVTGNQADYAQCVAYCDKVIESKRSQHVRGRNEMTEKEYPLADASDMYYDLFFSQNAEESIFELQSRSNQAVCQYYYKYKSATNAAGEGWLKAAPMFGGTSSVYNATSVFDANLFSASDMRYYAACYLPSNGEESYDIRKIISENPVTSKITTRAREAYNYGGLDRNYNVYRLTDVMLMKAEALVQQVDTTQDATSQADQLRVSFNLIQAVNNRAIHQDNLADSIKWATFRNFSKDQFEKMILQERLREFCFEGRRWYDLLRYNYRHVEGVDYNRTLAQQQEEGMALVPNSKDMLDLMSRSRGSEASGVKAKMANEAYLYLPVPNSDIIVCPLLRQNPAYKDMNDYEKSY